MDLRHYLLLCPSCGTIWGRTDELTQDMSLDENEEQVERAPCPACRNRSKLTTGENPYPSDDRG